jgi:hypothetical protein
MLRNNDIDTYFLFFSIQFKFDVIIKSKYKIDKKKSNISHRFIYCCKVEMMIIEIKTLFEKIFEIMFFKNLKNLFA